MTATFLTIAKNASIEAGIPGTGPASVDSNTGDHAKLIKWINDAWSFIQEKNHKKWLFMRANSSVSTVVDKINYNLTEAGAPDLAYFLNDTIEFDDGLTIQVIGPEEWRNQGFHRSSETGKPTHCLFDNNYIRFHPAPDQVYALTYRYIKEIQVLTGNTDTPLLPDRYAAVIEYLAAKRYAEYQEDNEKIRQLDYKYFQLLSKMELKQLPSLAQAGW